MLDRKNAVYIPHPSAYSLSGHFARMSINGPHPSSPAVASNDVHIEGLVKIRRLTFLIRSLDRTDIWLTVGTAL